MADDNVVIFPKAKKNTAPQSIEEIRNSIDSARKEHIEILLDEFMSYITSRSYEEGFDFTSNETYKSVFFMMDATRAALYKTKELVHPLHRIIDIAVEENNVNVDVIEEHLESETGEEQS